MSILKALFVTTATLSVLIATLVSIMAVLQWLSSLIPTNFWYWYFGACVLSLFIHIFIDMRKMGGRK